VACRRPDDGIEEIVAQLEEATTIRLLLAEDPNGTELACTWAQEWVSAIQCAEHYFQTAARNR
jgi:hypothetical protein